MEDDIERLAKSVKYDPDMADEFFSGFVERIRRDQELLLKMYEISLETFAEMFGAPVDPEE